MQNNEERFEHLLDRALRDYSGAEPLAGLEQRILNRIRNVQPAADRRTVWRFAVVAMLLVSIAVAAFLRMKPDRHVQTPVVARLQPPAAPVFIERAQAKRVQRTRPARRVRSLRRLPKQEQFPTPSPMTGEERALVAFVEHHPAEAQKAFADLEEQSSRPIVIAPIEIAPLEEKNP